MRTTHLTDKEIQQYALDRDTSDSRVRGHIDSCEQCHEKAEAYRLLFAGLREQPRESFDFDLPGLVVQQLPLPVLSSKPAKENVLVYAFIIPGVAIIGFALYYFRKYMRGVFESITPLFIYLVLTVFITLSMFLIADIYKKYKKKLHTLDLYRG